MLAMLDAEKSKIGSGCWIQHLAPSAGKQHTQWLHMYSHANAFDDDDDHFKVCSGPGTDPSD